MAVPLGRSDRLGLPDSEKQGLSGADHLARIDGALREREDLQEEKVARTRIRLASWKCELPV